MDNTHPSSGGLASPPQAQTAMPAQLSWEYVSRIARSPAEYNKLSREQQKQLSAWIVENKKRT